MSEQFLLDLAHELRGPMAPIANGIAILKLTTPRNHPSREVVVMLERQMGVLTMRLNNLLPPVH